jgi:hypothetical protein
MIYWYRIRLRYGRIDMTIKLAQFDSRLSRQVVMLAWRFVQRWDLYAQQLDDGRYICIHQPLTIKHLLSHLDGRITLGTYMLDMGSKTRFMALDADDEQGFDRLGILAKDLADKGLPAYLEKSRRGGHLWLFFTKAVSGYEARTFGSGILVIHKIQDVELYPKQDKLAEGPGSLLRMPFGIHRLTGKRYGFFDQEHLPLAPTLREQIEVLSDPQAVPEAAFMDYQSKASKIVRNPYPEKNSDAKDLVARIKNQIRVLNFVSRYVDLKPVGSGAVGLCPFHDDKHASFSVNDHDNYWKCFAGCGGGSVIDFWMKWNNCDFTVAVNELAQMLL